MNKRTSSVMWWCSMLLPEEEYLLSFWCLLANYGLVGDKCLDLVAGRDEDWLLLPVELDTYHHVAGCLAILCKSWILTEFVDGIGLSVAGILVPISLLGRVGLDSVGLNWFPQSVAGCIPSVWSSFVLLQWFSANSCEVAKREASWIIKEGF